MLTLLLMAIPGVNIIALICYLIFAKAQPKRSYMLAVLIWSILIVVGVALETVRSVEAQMKLRNYKGFLD